jgi:hypothetical protein
MELTHFTNNIPASNPNLTKLWVEQTYPSEMSNGQIAERAKHSAKHHLFSMKPPTSMPAKDWWQMQESLSRAVTKEHINQALDDLDAMDSRLRDYSPTLTFSLRAEDGPLQLTITASKMGRKTEVSFPLDSSARSAQDDA